MTARVVTTLRVALLTCGVSPCRWNRTSTPLPCSLDLVTQITAPDRPGE